MSMIGDAEVNELRESYQFTYTMVYQLEMDGTGYRMFLYCEPNQNYYGLYIDYGDDLDYTLLMDPDRELCFLLTGEENKTAIPLSKDDLLFQNFWKSIPGNNPSSDDFHITHLKFKAGEGAFYKGQLITSPEGTTEVWLTMKADFPYIGGIPEAAYIPKESWASKYPNQIFELTFTPNGNSGTAVFLSLSRIEEKPFEINTRRYDLLK